MKVLYVWKYPKVNQLVIIPTWKFMRIQIIITKENYRTKI